MILTQKLGLMLAGLAGAAAVAAVGVFLILSSGSSVQAGGTILTIIAGDVTVQEDGASVDRAAVDGEELSQGDRVVTGPDGRAVITFFDGSTQTLSSDTDITLDKLTSNSSGGLSAEIQQDKGTTWNNVLRPEDSVSEFKVNTPAAVGAVRDTSFLVTVDVDGTTEFWSRMGTVDVTSEGEGRGGRPRDVFPDRPRRDPRPSCPQAPR